MQALPRYSGIPTFMRVPFAQRLEDFDIALAGVPFDGGVTARPGARYGPREIRNMSSMMRAIYHVTGFNPFEACRVADVGDVPFTADLHTERFFSDAACAQQVLGGTAPDRRGTTARSWAASPYEGSR